MRCSTCPKDYDPLTEFRDALSARESRISGCCQSCQDEVFCDLYKPGATVCKKPCCAEGEDEDA